MTAIDHGAMGAFVRAVRDTLRSAREQRRWTQKATARRLNLTASALTKLETGTTRLDMDQFIRWCLVLDVEPIALITVAQLAAFPTGWPTNRPG